MKKPLFFASIPAILLTTNILAYDQGSSIGLNFGADEVAGSGSGMLAPCARAGVVPQANWNNLSLRAGTASGLVTDVLGKATDSSVSVTWSCPNTWSTTAGGPNNEFPDGPNRTLMTGYLDTDEGTGVATVTVSGLGPEFTHNNYDVIVYVLGGGAGSGGAYTIGSTTLFGTSPRNPTTHVEDPGVDLMDTGTYVRFRNLSGESFTLTASANAADYPLNSVNFRAPINGIQIVSRDTTGPHCISASASPTLSSIVVRFDEIVDATSEDQFNYTVADFFVNTAMRNADGTSVTLTLDRPLSPGTTYQVIIQNVSDLAGNVIDSNPPAGACTVNSSGFDQDLSIGLNFGADEVAGSGSGTLAPSDRAGVFPQANWNNLFLRAGTASGLVTDVLGKPIGSSVSVTWSSPNTWSTTAGGPNNGFPAGADRTLMTGYLDTDEGTSVATVTVSGLGPNFTHANYDVIVYVLGGTAGRGGAYTIGATTLFGSSPANPATHAEDPGVNLTDTGTYVVFRNLSGETFTLTASANAAAYEPDKVNFRAPINGIQIVSRAPLQNLSFPSDPIVLVNGMNDNDGAAGQPPPAETVDHAIDGFTQKYLNFLDLDSGFATTPSRGPTIAQGIRFYTANDEEERDPASYVLAGSNTGTGGPWTTIASGPLDLPCGRNPGGNVPIDPSTQFNQLIAFPNTVAYTSYRVTFPTLKNSDAANSMQIGEVELLGFRPNHCPIADAMSVSVSPGAIVSFQLPGSDPDNDVLLYNVSEHPSHGAVLIPRGDSSVDYISFPGYCGPDSFKYVVHDGTCFSLEATVSITVGGRPILSCPADITVVATGSAGRVVNYDLPTVNIPIPCPPITDLSCSPASGSTFPLGTTTVVCTATDSVGNRGTCSFKVTVQSADVFLTKSVDRITAKSGQTLTYSISVKNVGTASANGVVVNDPIPQQTTFSLASASQGTFTAPPVGSAGTVTWTVGNLAAGATATFKLQVKVSARGKDLVVNTATVSSSTFDSNPNNNSASITTRRKVGP